MPRPKINDEMKHVNKVNVRFTDSEFATVKNHAEQIGIPVSVFVRDCAMGRVKRIRIIKEVQAVFPELEEELKNIARQLSPIGNNLNQIGRYFNMGGEGADEVRRMLDSGIRALIRIEGNMERMTGELSGNLKAHIQQKR